MALHNPSFRQRLGSALRILTARGDNAEVCSFCGRSRLDGETIVAGPGVAICGTCAHLSLSCVIDPTADSSSPTEHEVLLTVFADPACLMPPHRASLATDLAKAAVDSRCRLLNWSYNCSMSAGDHIFVRLARTEDATGEQVIKDFTRKFLRT